MTDLMALAISQTFFTKMGFPISHDFLTIIIIGVQPHDFLCNDSLQTFYMGLRPLYHCVVDILTGILFKAVRA